MLAQHPLDLAVVACLPADYYANRTVKSRRGSILRKIAEQRVCHRRIVVMVERTAESGLKVPSVVRFDKLATLDRAVVAGRIGAAPADWLRAQWGIFFGAFGFGQPWRESMQSCGDSRCGWGCHARAKSPQGQ
jgi:hypothetical protein